MSSVLQSLVPLQIPGLPELIILFFIFVLSVAVALGAAYWVYTDASKRGRETAGIWAALTALGFFVGFVPGVVVVVVYLITRD